MDDEGGFIQSSPKKEFPNTRTLRSLTSLQISSIDPEDTGYSNIIIIGFVRDVKQTSSGSIFQLDDGTSETKCTFWPNSPIDEEASRLIVPSNFLKCIGGVRFFDGKKSVQVISLSLIEDFNYLTYHFTSCIHQYLYYNNRIKKERVTKSGGRVLDEVLECFRTHQTENGLHINVVVNILSKQFSEKEVRESVQTLLSDCHLFSVDGEEYKTTV